MPETVEAGTHSFQSPDTLNAQLHAREEQMRVLYLQEQRRARHLSLINEVQKCALATRDVESFLPQVTRAIGSHFADCDITLYLANASRYGLFAIASPLGLDAQGAPLPLFNEAESRSDVGHTEASAMVVIARTGDHGLGARLGTRHPDETPDEMHAGEALGESHRETPDGESHPGETPSGETPSGETPSGETPSGETPSGETPSGETPSGETPSGETPSGETPSGETPSGETPSGETPSGETPSCLHPDTRSSLHVPISIEGQCSGLILVQSRESDVLDPSDVGALNTATAIIASHLQNSRLFRNMSEINNFNQSLLNSMLHSLLVVDAEGRIRFVNQRLSQTFGVSRQEILHESLESVFGEGPARHHGLRDVIAEVLETGEGREVPDVHVRAPQGLLVFDVRLFRVYFRGRAEAALLLINLTQRWRQNYRLQMMHEIGRLFQGSLDIEHVLSSVLTCITAGSALGFNRAFVFLLNESTNQLEGRMALGPSSAEEASRIWAEISQRELTLPELLEQTERTRGQLSPLQERVMSLKISLGNPCYPAITRAIESKTALAVPQNELVLVDACVENHRREFEAAASLFCATEAAIAPLLAKDRLVGIVLTDNLYSGAAIDDGDVQLLDTLAQQAGLTIDNALAYEALQSAQRELVSAERLVAVGEMAARVSHEIRNPLATIGGFARSVLKKSEDVANVRRKVGVIVSEVARLEELLTDLLDMARPRGLDLQPHNLNEIVEHGLLLADADIRAYNVSVEKEFETDLPPANVDRGRLLQALLNTIRNGAQAMPDGGTLRVSTRLGTRPSDGAPRLEIEIKDSGVGISQRALQSVFDPFFSTKVSGSGLGLAVTKRILQDHGGHIEVASEEGVGTTFVFCLPLETSEKPAAEDAILNDEE